MTPAGRRSDAAPMLGVVGGIGPESTIAYYRSIIATARDLRPDSPHLSVLINSIDVQKVLRLAGENRLSALTDYLVAEIEVLANGGASVGLLAANTPHIVFEEVRQRSPIPLVSIVEAAASEVKRLRLCRVALLGTRFTMRGRFYPDVFARSGVEIVVPNEQEQGYVHEKYVGELLNSVFLDETRDGLLAIVKRLKERDGAEAVILGGTELPLLLTADSASGIPLLDTTRIHVAAALKELWA